MNSFLLKQAGAVLLGAINLVLLVMALTAQRRRQSLSEGFYRLLSASVAVAAFLVGMGLFLVIDGLAIPRMHLFYGVLVGGGVVGQAALSRGTALGQRYRAKPMVYAFFALLVLLTAIRSYMSAV